MKYRKYLIWLTNYVLAEPHFGATHFNLEEPGLMIGLPLVHARILCFFLLLFFVLFGCVVFCFLFCFFLYIDCFFFVFFVSRILCQRTQATLHVTSQPVTSGGAASTRRSPPNNGTEWAQTRFLHPDWVLHVLNLDNIYTSRRQTGSERPRRGGPCHWPMSSARRAWKLRRQRRTVRRIRHFRPRIFAP